ncbi:MAG: hypothetical protein DMF41_08375 [Verrucomicrobia bacterium]|nr:MAG: hypothetical protein DME62_03590 [Verrucomicrobiota bacterium]PYL19841.1 MAG: hypothetical protein DMF41_08375 [Verrucomicrobiota bacterium]
MYESQALDVDYIDIDEYVGATPKSSGSASAFSMRPHENALPQSPESKAAITAASETTLDPNKQKTKNCLTLV